MTWTSRALVAGLVASALVLGIVIARQSSRDSTTDYQPFAGPATSGSCPVEIGSVDRLRDPQFSGTSSYADGTQSADAALYATSWALQLIRQLDHSHTPATSAQRELLMKGTSLGGATPFVLSDITRIDLAVQALIPMTPAEKASIEASLQQLRAGDGYALNVGEKADFSATAVALRVHAAIGRPAPAAVVRAVEIRAKNARWVKTDLSSVINQDMPLVLATLDADPKLAEAVLLPRWRKVWQSWVQAAQDNGKDGTGLSVVASITRINRAWGLPAPTLDADAWRGLRTGGGMYRFSPERPADFQVTSDAATAGLVEQPTEVVRSLRSREFVWGWLSPTVKPSLRGAVAAVLIDAVCGRPLPAFPIDAVTTASPSERGDRPYLTCVLYRVYGERPDHTPAVDPGTCRHGTPLGREGSGETILQVLEDHGDGPKTTPAGDEVLGAFCGRDMTCAMRAGSSPDVYATAIGVVTSRCAQTTACRTAALSAFLAGGDVRETATGGDTHETYPALAAAVIARGSAAHLPPLLALMQG